MAGCKKCKKTGFGIFEIKEGMCPSCRKAAEFAEASKTEDQKHTEMLEAKRVKLTATTLPLTTEAFVGDVERLDIVATEVVLGMNLFKDVLVNIRDIFGGRSGTVQNTLEEARELAFADLRLKAAKLGADAVIAVDIDYHTISTGSSVNMMIVAVSGTAIKWRTTS